MGRNENVLVFEDTRSWYKTDPELMEAINSSNRQQQLILETDAVAKGTQRYAEPAQIIVSRKRSFEAAQAYPEFGFDRNMGYGTAEHIAALKQFGATPIHRRTFIGNFVKKEVAE